ncbi:EVE domain-containing protein [Streptomyces sp. NPDC096132]|uniref:EVE domain-containing protein n=1 Tax=Streptomyces sp. NPDC096132 TaxID=3366075 RepID=UPI003827E2A9
MTRPPGPPEQAWLGIVSGEHARHAVNQAMIQINHGKRHNLARMHRGDGFVFYSPTQRRGGATPLRAFTALGVIADDEPYQADEVMNMGSHGILRPWRRRVDFLSVRPLDLRDVTYQLRLTQDRHWGYRLRLGCIPLAVEDFQVLYGAMAAAPGTRHADREGPAVRVPRPSWSNPPLFGP